MGIRRLTNIKQSEEHIVKHALLGKRWAQENIYKSYSPKMYGVCLRYANNEADAKEFLQSGFIKVFINLEKYSAKGSLEGWIRTTIIRNILDTIKKRSKIREVELENIETEIYLNNEETSLYEGLSEELILGEIQKLDEKQKLIFNLFHLEEISHKEISEELNILESTSRSILRRAKQNLKKALQKHITS